MDNVSHRANALRARTDIEEILSEAKAGAHALPDGQRGLILMLTFTTEALERLSAAMLVIDETDPHLSANARWLLARLDLDDVAVRPGQVVTHVNVSAADRIRHPGLFGPMEAPPTEIVDGPFSLLPTAGDVLSLRIDGSFVSCVLDCATHGDTTDLDRDDLPSRLAAAMLMYGDHVVQVVVDDVETDECYLALLAGGSTGWVYPEGVTPGMHVTGLGDDHVLGDQPLRVEPYLLAERPVTVDVERLLSDVADTDGLLGMLDLVA